MIDPGELNRRLVLEAPVETPDGAGGVTRSYAIVTTLWASVRPAAARGDMVGAAAGATVTHRIVMRAGGDLTTRHRLRDGARIFRIVALRDRDGAGRLVEIAAQERVDWNRRPRAIGAPQHGGDQTRLRVLRVGGRSVEQNFRDMRPVMPCHDAANGRVARLHDSLLPNLNAILLINSTVNSQLFLVSTAVGIASAPPCRHDCCMKSRKAAKGPQTRNADATRAKILQAALSEFSERGMPAASTDDIAERCGVNKRMIYYYFGSKEGLYLAALESVYEDLVAREKEINVEHLEPPAAIEAMINLKIDYYLENPYFISFLSMENFYKARHLRKSKKLKMFKTPLTDVITRILKRGQRSGEFRPGIEPIDFYVSLCALCIMYFSNQHTFGAIFGREMTTPSNIERRRRAVVDFVLGYLQKPSRVRPTGGPVLSDRGNRVDNRSPGE